VNIGSGDNTISFRFRFARKENPILGPKDRAKIWKTPDGRKKLFSPRNSLKGLKAAKEMFAKIWRKQAFIWKNLPKKLGRLHIRTPNVT